MQFFKVEFLERNYSVHLILFFFLMLNLFVFGCFFFFALKNIFLIDCNPNIYILQNTETFPSLSRNLSLKRFFHFQVSVIVFQLDKKINISPLLCSI